MTFLFDKADDMDAEIFFHEIRKILEGWVLFHCIDIPVAIPKNSIFMWFIFRNASGLIFEGVPDNVLTGAEGKSSDHRSRIYKTASAGQTIGLPSIDTFLGIDHYPGILKFL